MDGMISCGSRNEQDGDDCGDSSASDERAVCGDVAVVASDSPPKETVLATRAFMGGGEAAPRKRIFMGEALGITRVHNAVGVFATAVTLPGASRGVLAVTIGDKGAVTLRGVPATTRVRLIVDAGTCAVGSSTDMMWMADQTRQIAG